MNYQAIYDRIVARGKERVIEGYKERHHIIPRCMNGSDESDNLVDLTPEEHFFCHKLLVKIHPTVKGLATAVIFMGSGSHRTTAKTYGWVRRRLSERLRTTIAVNCTVCNKVRVVDPYLIDKNLGKYCSTKCMGIGRGFGSLYEKKCVWCNDTFSGPKWRIKDQKTCSMNCGHKLRLSHKQ